MPDVLTRCRELLGDITPLRFDCGLLCGAACCRSLPGEETGMALFPGEERLCPEAGWRLLPHPLGQLAVCPGVCDRGERPLACRMFPLLPLLRESGVRVAVDARARAVCPLARQGLRAFSGEFVEAVRACGEALAEDPAQRGFLARLTAEQDELRALRRAWEGGADRHV